MINTVGERDEFWTGLEVGQSVNTGMMLGRG